MRDQKRQDRREEDEDGRRAETLSRVAQVPGAEADSVIGLDLDFRDFARADATLPGEVVAPSLPKALICRGSNTSLPQIIPIVIK